MAQPTRCDGQADRRRLSQDNPRETTNGEEGCQGRKEEGREEAVVLRQAVRGCSVEHPFFLGPRAIPSRNTEATSCCAPDHAPPVGSVPRSENADIRADVPGGRVRRMMRQDSRASKTTKVKGGIQMAKKAAKGAKKKAAKKR